MVKKKSSPGGNIGKGLGKRTKKRINKEVGEIVKSVLKDPKWIDAHADKNT